MSKTALLNALKHADLERVRAILRAQPELKQLRNDKGFNLLQIAASRATVDDPAAANRQLRLAKWLVGEGLDPRAIHVTAPGEDGEEDAARVSLAWFAVAKAQNNRLARYFLQQGAAPGALFAAAWWGNADILPDLVRHGADLDEVAGATPLHMAVDVFQRGIEGNPPLARQRVKVLKELLRLGANPNVPSVKGATPLHLALKRDSFEAFAMLLRHGGDPDVPNRDGQTVREIAARKRDKRYLDAIEARS